MQKNRQNPVLFYLNALLYTVIALVIRLAALAPLACLLEEGAVRYVALLCPILLTFVVLPLRFSFAQAMVKENGIRRFSLSEALSFSDYGEKLKESLMHAFHVIKWGIPLFALCAYGYLWYTEVDALTVMRSVTALGASASEVWCSVHNFFAGLFGWAEKVPVSSALMEGVYVVGGVVAAAALIWMYGAVRLSAWRYLWVLSERNDRPARADRRRRLRGRRMKQLLTALVNLVLIVPFVWVSAVVLSDAVNDLGSQLMMVITGSMPQVDWAGILTPMAVTFFALYLPLLPVRRWHTAGFAQGEPKRKAAVVEK